MSKKTMNKVKSLLLNDTLIVTMIAIIMGLLVGAVVLAVAGYNPLIAYKEMFFGIFSRWKYIGWSLVRSTPLILTGLSVAFAFKTGLFNIGAEGQFMVGALTAAILGYVIELPALLHIPIVILGASIAAGAYGGLSGYMKAKYGVHEVISTIMLNWIALYLSNFMVGLEFFKNPGPESSYPIHETARLSIKWLKPLVGPGVKANWGLLISIAVVIFISHYLFKTVQGYELRTVGHNKNAAEYAGINVDKCIVKSMSIAGALAGLAGAMHVMGVSYNVSKLAVSEGYGFNGIAVALIGNNSPIGVFLSALFFGGLQYGSKKMQGVPSEIINIVFGSIIFFIAVSRIFKFVLVHMEKRRKQAEEVQ